MLTHRDVSVRRIALIDALGGSSVGMLICNLAPGDKYAKDTLRTLKYVTAREDVDLETPTDEAQQVCYPDKRD